MTIDAALVELLDLRSRPEVKGGCLRCGVTPEDVNEYAKVIVSPTGLAHFGQSDGDTHCGINATGPRWWWPC